MLSVAPTMKHMTPTSAAKSENLRRGDYGLQCTTPLSHALRGVFICAVIYQIAIVKAKS